MSYEVMPQAYTDRGPGAYTRLAEELDGIKDAIDRLESGLSPVLTNSSEPPLSDVSPPGTSEMHGLSIQAAQLRKRLMVLYERLDLR